MVQTNDILVKLIVEALKANPTMKYDGGDRGYEVSFDGRSFKVESYPETETPIAASGMTVDENGLTDVIDFAKDHFQPTDDDILTVEWMTGVAIVR